MFCLVFIGCYCQPTQFRFEFLGIIDRARVKKSCSNACLAYFSGTTCAKELYLFCTFLKSGKIIWMYCESQMNDTLVNYSLATRIKLEHPVNINVYGSMLKHLNRSILLRQR